MLSSYLLLYKAGANLDDWPDSIQPPNPKLYTFNDDDPLVFFCSLLLIVW